MSQLKTMKKTERTQEDLEDTPSVIPSHVPTVVRAAAGAGGGGNRLDAALSRGEAILQTRNQIFAALADTHARIPALLAEKIKLTAELSAGELRGEDIGELTERLTQIEAERRAAVRMRSASTAALVDQTPDLTSALATITAAKQPFIEAMVADFQRRYTILTGELVTLWREADTPFNGTHNAGIQVLNTSNFPDDHGPLRDVHPSAPSN